MLKKRFREYFTYTKRERNGVIVLLFILLALIVVRIYQSNKSYGEISIMDAQFKKEIEEFEKSFQPIEMVAKAKYIKPKSGNKSENDWFIPEELFYFDPNTISESDLLKLGFSKKQVRTLCNYREKGGKFYSKEGLLNIYGINEIQYRALEGYIKIEQISAKNNYKKKVELLLVNINNATPAELVKLKGIGETYAKRIVKYRDKLGGFYSKDQLLEVYGLDSVTIDGFKNNIVVDSSFVQKISLNNADYKMLISHPYLNKYQTQSILKYKEVIGKFEQIEQIYLNKLLTKDEYLRLKPYLKLN